MKKIALYAGSFDPVTRGHLNIIRRALDMFDEVVVAIGVNYEKKGLFTAEERMRLIYDAVDKNDLAFGRCLIRTFDGLAAHRGVRSDPSRVRSATLRSTP